MNTLEYWIKFISEKIRSLEEHDHWYWKNVSRLETELYLDPDWKKARAFYLKLKNTDPLRLKQDLKYCRDLRIHLQNRNFPEAINLVENWKIPRCDFVIEQPKYSRRKKLRASKGLYNFHEPLLEFLRGNST